MLASKLAVVVGIGGPGTTMQRKLRIFYTCILQTLRKKPTDNIKKNLHRAGRHAVASKLAVVVGIGDYNAKKTKEGLVCEQICIMTHFWV